MMSAHPVIFSLTDRGQKLGKRIQQCYPASRHLHCPPHFRAEVEHCFTQGHPLVMICATGIVVRTLANVLQDKYQDPPVLVLDDQGQFVIPLLSGHEGGANEWGRQLADHLGAQLVLTSHATYTRPCYVLGMGCERGTPLSTLESLVETGLHLHQLTFAEINAIASIELKSDEDGLLALANKHQWPIHFYSTPTLRTYDAQLTQRSDIVYRETGCYGVAEAAALAGAEAKTGTKAELILAKIKNKQATLAIARAYLKPEVTL